MVPGILIETNSVQSFFYCHATLVAYYSSCNPFAVAIVDKMSNVIQQMQKGLFILLV
jgi:hypothetical protein